MTRRTDHEHSDELRGHVPVAGVLLAAGAGRRYGMPKVLVGEGEWLRWAVGALVEGVATRRRGAGRRGGPGCAG